MIYQFARLGISANEAAAGLMETAANLQALRYGFLTVNDVRLKCGLDAAVDVSRMVLRSVFTCAYCGMGRESRGSNCHGCGAGEVRP